MSRDYKNILNLTYPLYGDKERSELFSEILKDSNPLPKTVTYEDIDKEMHRWVDEELGISFEGQRLPMMDLFSNQRFSEYLQSWKFVDENNNLILNFKTLTRENNPKSGSLNGDTKNIPGDRTYLMKRLEAQDANQRKYYIDYRMKQPFTIDFNYTISVMTNRYELINAFNTMVNEKFKSITNYIRPNGHHMPMNLGSISDESQYNIDDRQFYSQSYEITVKAYIITEDSFQVVEVPKMKFLGFEGESKRAVATIEEAYGACPENPYHKHNIPIKLTVDFDICCQKAKFTMDCDFMVTGITCYENSAETTQFSFKLEENDTEITERKDFILHNNAEIKISKIRRYVDRTHTIVFTGYDMEEVFDSDIEEGITIEESVEC